MKLIDVVNLAQAQGHIVKYRKRSDGGIIVTSLDGLDFKDLTTGNKMLREVTGQSLSKLQVIQREAINKPLRIPKNATKQQREKIEKAAKARKASVKKVREPDDLEREIRKTQRVWRKNVDESIYGRITTKKIRHIEATQGKAAAFEALRKAQSYARGYAYPENVLHLAERIEMGIIKTLKSIQRTEENKELLDAAIAGGEALITLIKSKSNAFKEEWITVINAIVYDTVNIFGIASSDIERIQILNDALMKIKSIIS